MERKPAVKSDWNTEDMPRRRARFKLERHFTEEEIKNLKYGNIPQEMEDKWFYYFEDGKLYAHRSWSGFCIFIVEFDFESDKHKVTVNRNPKQYTGTKEDDIEMVNSLLNWWVLPAYDYYGEWIEETAEAIERAKN